MSDEKILDDFAAAEAEKKLDAIKDLETIEAEALAEAEESVEAADRVGDEEAAVEAAETAYEFDQAEIDVEKEA